MNVEQSELHGVWRLVYARTHSDIKFIYCTEWWTSVCIHANLKLNYWYYFISSLAMAVAKPNIQLGLCRNNTHIISTRSLVCSWCDQNIDAGWLSHSHPGPVPAKCLNREQSSSAEHNSSNQPKQTIIYNGEKHVGINFNYTTFFGLMCRCLAWRWWCEFGAGYIFIRADVLH